MITSVRFCLSNDLSNAILSSPKFVYCNENLQYVLVLAESVMQRVIITLVMIWHYELNNSNVTINMHVKIA